MLIKSADDHTEELSYLERWLNSADRDTAKTAEKELNIRRAGLRGEAESAYLIDFGFAETRNWAVIHDLRLEHNGRTAQIDHLLINRGMECFVLESKHFHAGVKITDEGEFLRWNDYKRAYEGMPSPLEQNDRHIAVLRDVVKTLPMPTRMGLRINLDFHSFVLVSPSARIDRPKAFDTSRILKADQLTARVMRDIDDENGLSSVMKLATKVVSSDTLREVAQLLVSQHRPIRWSLPPALEKTTTITSSPAPPVTAKPSKIAEDGAIVASTVPQATDTTIEHAPACKNCSGHDGSIQYGKYGYYFRCAQCNTNTTIRFTCLPGHHPKPRKAGQQFFRDCPECDRSELYFTNP